MIGNHQVRIESDRPVKKSRRIWLPIVAVIAVLLLIGLGIWWAVRDAEPAPESESAGLTSEQIQRSADTRSGNGSIVSYDAVTRELVIRNDDGQSSYRLIQGAMIGQGLGEEALNDTVLTEGQQIQYSYYEDDVESVWLLD